MNDKFEVTYNALFRLYYPNLLFYVTRLVGEADAEDIIQDVFCELWRRKDTMILGDQIQSYLYRSAYTRALNVLKRRVVKDKYSTVMEEINRKRVESYCPHEQNEIIKRLENRELQLVIKSAIDELPEKCKVVFRLSYLHDMKNKEISETMGISLRTVEAHIYKALKTLRARLADLHLLFFSCFLFSM